VELYSSFMRCTKGFIAEVDPILRLHRQRSRGSRRQISWYNVIYRRWSRLGQVRINLGIFCDMRCEEHSRNGGSRDLQSCTALIPLSPAFPLALGGQGELNPRAPAVSRIASQETYAEHRNDAPDDSEGITIRYSTCPDEGRKPSEQPRSSEREKHRVQRGLMDARQALGARTVQASTDELRGAVLACALLTGAGVELVVSPKLDEAITAVSAVRQRHSVTDMLAAFHGTEARWMHVILAHLARVANVMRGMSTRATLVTRLDRAPWRPG